MSSLALNIVRIEMKTPEFAILPWEDPQDYAALLQLLADDYEPRGPMQHHWVEEVASILWRKRRVALAEAALYRKGLDNARRHGAELIGRALAHTAVSSRHNPDLARDGHITGALAASPELAVAELSCVREHKEAAQRASDILAAGGQDAYEQALDVLPPDTRGWWQDALAGEWQDSYGDEDEAYTADTAGLGRFLEAKALPWYEAQIAALQNRPTIAAQAYGEAADPERLMMLARYEAHLDRKLERIIGLIRADRLNRG